MPESLSLTPIWITLKLAGLTTLLLLVLGTPLAWWLAHRRGPLKSVLEALVAMPLVLPPTVLGFYLLLALAPGGMLGGPWAAMTGHGLAFSFSGLVLGSVVYSMPFVVQPLQNTFETLGTQLLEAAETLGAGPLDRFFSVALPLARGGLVTAATLGFAHTVGEFGVVLMIGGNIPGETRVLSIAIYDHVETLDYATAHLLSSGLIIFAFIVLLAVYRLHRQWSPLVRR